MLGHKKKRRFVEIKVPEEETPRKRTRSTIHNSTDGSPGRSMQHVESTPKRRSARQSRTIVGKPTEFTLVSTPNFSVGVQVTEDTDDGGSFEDPKLGNVIQDSKSHVRSSNLQGKSDLAFPSLTPMKVLLATPKKNKEDANTKGTPTIVRCADRSARRKSSRTLIQNFIGSGSGDEVEDEGIAEQIYLFEEVEQNDGEDELAIATIDNSQEPLTPSQKKRGRVPRQRSRSPELPGYLTPHENYFAQNRPNRGKTSNANLSSLALLDHGEYFNLVHGYEDRHTKEMVNLQDLHARSFAQWQFELGQNFSIALFGWGSKRSLLLKFAEYMYETEPDVSTNKIVIVNGYVQTLTIKDVLNTVAAAVSDCSVKLGSQPPAMLEKLNSLLEEDTMRQITLIIHSVDGPPLRRLTSQTILARLSAHPQIHLIASVDHLSFPLLWDSSLRSSFNFLFHDCTTFQPYTVETDVVDDVHDLLGRSGRRVGGKEGVSFVLKSLNENSRNLFRVLIGEQLAAMDEVGGADMDEDEHGTQICGTRKPEVGVEYRMLYHKAVQEFICSNEMNFRTLLKEFHDHQMIRSRKDPLGTEFLSVPFRKEELEVILENMTA